MDRMPRWTKAKFYLLSFILFCVLAGNVIAEPVDVRESIKTESQVELEEKATEKPEVKRPRVVGKISDEEIALLDLPADTTKVMTASELRITGNTLLTTEELLSGIPAIYNSSNLPLLKAASSNLYDFRTVLEIIESPGQVRSVSARTIRGLTRCLLGIYKAKGFSGILVSVPPSALEGGELRNNVLLITVTEAAITAVTTNYYTPDNEIVEEGYLKSSFIQKWSPIEIGEVGKEKELNEFVNLLNINPDRYVSATVSKGAEPGTLAVGYNIYEANPWHYFLQIDNAGTNDRQWTPRAGVINTNLTGIDDRFTLYYQAPWNSDIMDEYSIYGSYDLPIMGPKLRLELFAGYNQFDTDGGGGIEFLGHGSLYGGKLRYNAFQDNGWFFDLTTSLSHEKSRVTSSVLSGLLPGTGEVKMDLLGIGVDIHKRSDMANSSITYDRVQNVGGSSQSKFWDSVALTGARENAEKDFVLHTVAANHSQYLDTDKIERLSGSVRWIVPEDRLVPAKMTTFGGMYSVRGYNESRIVTDGGVLASVQYEYDLIKRDVINGVARSDAGNIYELKKLAPLVFFDYGQAKMKDSVPGETGSEELYSVGIGALVEIGANLSGAVYYGYPLEATDTTDRGDGRINVNLMMRW